jgi:hypothetical protein
MQKIALSRIIREEVIRALVFGISFFAILSVGTVGVVYAADGGEFGRILNLILASGNWTTDTTGTVKNSEKLWGKAANAFVQTSGGFKCPLPNQCISGINSSGVPQCTP